MNASIPRLKVRKVNFQFKPNPLHWLNGNPIATHFNNAMHLVFPDGEKFFIRSVKAYYKQIKDPVLKKQIDDFVGQEGTHYKEHQKFWEILEAQGFKPEVFLNLYRKTAFEMVEKNLYELFGEEYGKKLALSVTVALEHYTAMFAESAFTNVPNFDMPEDMRKLMLWHAAEEIEHKAIPFDLLKQIDDSYFLRVNGMIIATLGLSFYIAAAQMILISQDKSINWKDMPGHLNTFVTGLRNGMGKTLLKHYFKYYRPDFHPDDIDNYHLAKDYFEANPQTFSA